MTNMTITTKLTIIPTKCGVELFDTLDSRFFRFGFEVTSKDVDTKYSKY
jgi:hypothetical protein